MDIKQANWKTPVLLQRQKKITSSAKQSLTFNVSCPTFLISLSIAVELALLEG